MPINTYAQAWEDRNQKLQALGIEAVAADKGATVTFVASSDRTLEYESLKNDVGKEHIELLNVKTEDGSIVSATVYVPKKKKGSLEKKITNYQNQEIDARSGKVKNRKLLDSIETIVFQSMEALWGDNYVFPTDLTSPIWWEVWLRKDTFENILTCISGFSLDLKISNKEDILEFPERDVCSIFCSLEDLTKIELVTNAFTSFKYRQDDISFFAHLENADQQDWVADLGSRISVNNESNSAVCIIDTGIRSEHLLLKPSISNENSLDTYDPDWGVEDTHGHGTEMAGISLFGDQLSDALASQDGFIINHSLESVKAFPSSRHNFDRDVPSVTMECVSRAETNNPNVDRVFNLSWTLDKKDGEVLDIKGYRGSPSALSSVIDKMAFGDIEENYQNKRLFSISVGNVNQEERHEYPDVNHVSEVLNPAQSWNALSVGAHTMKTRCDDIADLPYSPIAKSGLLSPSSRTSQLWDNQWPIKPDVVFEGGNSWQSDDLVTSVSGVEAPLVTSCSGTSVLTTGKNSPLAYSFDTSAANAQCSRLAAMLHQQYPDAHPETIRAIIVHSAEWSTPMLQEFPLNENVQSKLNLLRTYGYGIPTENIALNSFENHPHIIIQDELSPYREGSSGVVYDEMNYYDIPFPVEKLQDIWDKDVELKVTLSYFVEPHPSENPPKNRYDYASHGLRFDFQRNETKDAFLQRLTKAARDDDYSGSSQGKHQWRLGPKTRDRGCIISDVWHGKGADFAEQSRIAVYPISGWWKHKAKYPNEDKPNYKRRVRFSLIISLKTLEDIDLYTSIVNSITVPVTV